MLRGKRVPKSFWDSCPCSAACLACGLWLPLCRCTLSLRTGCRSLCGFGCLPGLGLECRRCLAELVREGLGTNAPHRLVDCGLVCAGCRPELLPEKKLQGHLWNELASRSLGPFRANLRQGFGKLSGKAVVSEALGTGCAKELSLQIPRGPSLRQLGFPSGGVP